MTNHELGGINPESIAEPTDVVDRNVGLGSFNRSNKRSMNVRPMR